MWSKTTMRWRPRCGKTDNNFECRFRENWYLVAELRNLNIQRTKQSLEHSSGTRARLSSEPSPDSSQIPLKRALREWWPWHQLQAQEKLGNGQGECSSPSSGTARQLCRRRQGASQPMSLVSPDHWFSWVKQGRNFFPFLGEKTGSSAGSWGLTQSHQQPVSEPEPEVTGKTNS